MATIKLPEGKDRSSPPKAVTAILKRKAKPATMLAVQTPMSPLSAVLKRKVKPFEINTIDDYYEYLVRDFVISQEEATEKDVHRKIKELQESGQYDDYMMDAISHADLNANRHGSVPDAIHEYFTDKYGEKKSMAMMRAAQKKGNAMFDDILDY